MFKYNANDTMKLLGKQNIMELGNIEENFWGVIRDIMTANGIPKESIGDKLFMMGINIVQYGVILLAKYRREDKATRHHEETKPVNENYREGIRKMIEQTEDTHALCCTYTIIKTHLMILAEKGGAI